MILHLTKTKIFYVVGVAALVIGGLIYVLFRPNTYVSQMVGYVLPLTWLSEQLSGLDCDFVKYYLADYLWAVSLSCGLHCIFKPVAWGSFVCAAVVIVFGGMYEVFQFLEIISGTGDWLDVVLYMLAGFTVNIIKFKGVVKHEEGH